MCLLAMSLQCKRPRFDPWVRKIPWRREWLSGPVFLPGEFQGQRSLMGYRPWGHKYSDRTEQLLLHLTICLSSLEKWLFCCCLVAESCLTVQPLGLQRARLPSPSPYPGICPSSYPLNQWCHPTMSSSVAHFSFCLQSFPAPGSFPMSCLFTSGGQSIGASASVSVLPKSIQGLIPLRFTGLLCLLSKGLSRVFCSTTV